MRTVRCSSHLRWGVWQGGVYLMGCVYPGGFCSGVVCLGECLPGGVSVRWVCTSPRTEFLTHACENITFPQLRLWTVKMKCVFLLKNKDKRTVWKNSDILEVPLEQAPPVPVSLEQTEAPHDGHVNMGFGTEARSSEEYEDVDVDGYVYPEDVDRNQTEFPRMYITAIQETNIDQ